MAKKQRMPTCAISGCLKHVKRKSNKYCSLSCSNAGRGKPPVVLPKRLQQKMHELPVKTQKIISGLASGKTKRQAGIDAGIPENKSLSSNVNRRLNTQQAQETLREIFIAEGFNDKHYAKTTFEGSLCMKSVGLIVHAMDKEGKLTEADEDSKEFVDVPDWGNRRHYLTMGAKALGHEDDKKDQAVGLSVTINIMKGGQAKPVEVQADAHEVPPARPLEINVKGR